MQFLTPLSVAKTIKEHRAYTSSRSASPSDARLDRISLVLHLQQHKMRRLRQLLELARQASGLHSLQQSGPRSSRAFSERPGRLEEYSNYYKKSDTISTRAQAEEAAEPAPAEPSTSAAEPSSTATEQPSNMQREGAQSATAWMFPWEKRQMDGSGPLRTWERIYWGGFVTALALFLFSRLGNKPAASTADPQAAEKLEAKRRDAARMILAGKSFTEGMDAFEGLSPQQIQEYVSQAAEGATSKDPFEGMSPEEINTYLEKQERVALCHTMLR